MSTFEAAKTLARERLVGIFGEPTVLADRWDHYSISFPLEANVRIECTLERLENFFSIRTTNEEGTGWISILQLLELMKVFSHEELVERFRQTRSEPLSVRPIAALSLEIDLLLDNLEVIKSRAPDYYR